MISPALCFLVCIAWAQLASAGSGDDFSSSLFSDIAPLIALFGDQVAKQYLSQSLGFLENVIFACSPLGILTAVTSSIRVGGPLVLRALIGRSQEPVIRVELELLRSTSADVCELWDGRQVVRTLGSPDILELVYDEDGCIHNRDEAMKLRPHRTIFSCLISLFRLKRQSSDIELSELHQLVSRSRAAPNIFLNGGSIQPLETHLVALIALTLQLGVLIFDVFSVYDTYLSQTLGTSGTPNDGLPLTVAGTLAVSIGVFICCCVIEARTRLDLWVPRDREQRLRIVWLQKSQNVNGQTFKSCAIFADTSRHEIVTSQLDDKRELGLWSCLGTFVTAVGFICQLIGLRTMRYEAAVAQFVATMIMSILRVVIRRDSTRRPVLDYNPCKDGNLNTFGIFELNEGHELNELAKRLAGCKEWTVCNGHIWYHNDFEEDLESNSVARKVLQNRLRLRELCGNFESVQTLADNLADTVEAIMNYIWSTRLQCLEDDKRLHWTVEVSTTGDLSSITKLDIPLFVLGDKWHVDRATIEAILGMWISELQNHGQPHSDNILWVLSYDDDGSCEKSQAHLDLLNPTTISLEPVPDIVEMCVQRQIDHWRVLYCGMTKASQQAKNRAMIGQSSLNSMCAQYLIMKFLFQMAANIQKPATPLSLEEDPESHVTRVRDPVFDTIRSLIRQSGLATEEDSSIITFCALAQTDKLLDPLSLLPQLVNAAVLQPEDDAGKTCSRICQLFKWNAMKLASKGLIINASELGLSLIGAFTEGFGYQHEETQKVRLIVQEAIFAAESRTQISHLARSNYPQDSIHAAFPQNPATADLLIDVKQTTQIYENELLVNSRASSQKPLLEVQDHEISNGPSQPIATREKLDENAFKAIIRAGDVGRVRSALLFDRAQYPTFLSNGMITAFDSTKKGCIFEQTEVIRLLALSGSGLDFGFRFNVTTLLSLAAQAGNVMLAELLLGKASKNNYRPDIFKALCTAIEFDHEAFVKFLISTGDKFSIDDRKGSQALRLAALHGRDAIVKYLISMGFDIQGHPNDMENALSRAASKNHDLLGKFLIEQELLISKGVGFRYQRGETSLHFVAAVGNINLVQVLLDAGWDVNAGERCVPLKEALRHGHEQVANLLIDNGSRIEDGMLHQVAEKGFINTARLVISKGADVNALDRQKRPVFEAARQGPKEKYKDFVKLLIENGAKVDVKDSGGMSVLLRASEDGYEGVSTLFLEAGASLTKRRADGTTIVHSAAKKGHVDIIRLLVEKGADLDTRDNNMNTTLNFAAAGGHTEVIRALLKAKPGDWVNGNSTDEYRNHPLYDAIIGGHNEVARLLVENGASIADHSFVDWRYSSPLCIAVRNRKAEIVHMFMDMGGGTLKDSSFGEIAKDSIESGHLETIMALLSKETAHPIKGKPSQATQHLPHAALRCKLDVVTLLLNLGADPSDNKALNTCIESSDNPNFTATNAKQWYEISKLLFLHNSPSATPLLPSLLRAATSRNNAEGVRFWLSHNAPIHTRYEGGRTVLHYAAAADAEECLALLLKANTAADFVNARAESGATALHTAVKGVKMYAASDSHLGVVKTLVAHGADPDLRALGDGQVWIAPMELAGHRSKVSALSDQGFTPLDEARRANLGLIVKFLEGLDRQ